MMERGWRLGSLVCAVMGTCGCAQVMSTHSDEMILASKGARERVETRSVTKLSMDYVGDGPFGGVLELRLMREDTCVELVHDTYERHRTHRRFIRNPEVVLANGGLALLAAGCAGVQSTTGECLSGTVTDSETGAERPMTSGEHALLVGSLWTITAAATGAVVVDLWRARDSTSVVGTEKRDLREETRACGVKPVAGEVIVVAAPWAAPPVARRVMTDEHGVARVPLEEFPLAQVSPGAPFASIKLGASIHSVAPLPEAWELARVTKLEAGAFERAVAAPGVAPLVDFLRRYPDGASAQKAHALIQQRPLSDDDIEPVFSYLARHGDQLAGSRRLDLHARAVAAGTQVYMKRYEQTWRASEALESARPELVDAAREAVIAYHLETLGWLGADDLLERDAHIARLAQVVVDSPNAQLPVGAIDAVAAHGLAIEDAVHRARTTIPKEVADAALARAEVVCALGQERASCTALATRRFDRQAEHVEAALSADPIDVTGATVALERLQELAVGTAHEERVGALRRRLGDRVALAWADELDRGAPGRSRLERWEQILEVATSPKTRRELAERAVEDLSEDASAAFADGDDDFMFEVGYLVDGIAPAERAFGPVAARAHMSRAERVGADGRIEDIADWQRDLRSAEAYAPRLAGRIAKLERALFKKARARNPLGTLSFDEALMLYPPREGDAQRWYQLVAAASKRSKGARVVVRLERSRQVGEDVLVEVVNHSTGERTLALATAKSRVTREALAQHRSFIALARIDGVIDYKQGGTRRRIATLSLLSAY